MEHDDALAPEPDDGAGRGVVRTVTLDCDRDQAWRLISTSDGLGRWLGRDVRLDPSVGGALGLRDDDGTVRTGHVVGAEEGRSLAFEWAPAGDSAARSTVTLTIDGDDHEVRLTVVERPTGGATAACLDAGAAWDQRLLGLELDVVVQGPLGAVTAPAL